MSNVKKVEIAGTMPFDCVEDAGMEHWLAVMNTPCYGLRIVWSQQCCDMKPNEFGGKTAIYGFCIMGEEAVSLSALDSLVETIRRVGGTVTTSRYKYIEN